MRADVLDLEIDTNQGTKKNPAAAGFSIRMKRIICVYRQLRFLRDGFVRDQQLFCL